MPRGYKRSGERSGGWFAPIKHRVTYPPKPKPKPTRSWWTDPNFYVVAKGEAERIRSITGGGKAE